MADVASICLLDGTLSLHDSQGTALPSPTERLQRRVLFALVVNAGHVVPRETLVRACYSHQEVRAGNEAKRVGEYLSELRKLGVPIARGKAVLGLSTNAVDLLRVDRLISGALDACTAAGAEPPELNELQHLLAQHRCDLASSFADIDTSGYLAPYVRRHHELSVIVIKRLVDSGEMGLAATEVARAQAIHPASRAISELGGAIDRAERVLTVMPPVAEPGVRHNLPDPLADTLIGRDAELSEALAVLRRYPASQHALLTIDGVGGVGKTELALAIGHHYVGPDAPTGEDGFAAVVWASAKRTSLIGSGIIERHQALRNLDDITHAVAVVLGRQDILAAAEDERLRRIREALSDHVHRTLLIIDNLETVDDERVLAFLRDLPAPTKAIITTRHRIDGARTIRLDGLHADDAESLALGEATRHGVPLDTQGAQNLALAAAGVPLAIIWTIAQVAHGIAVDDALLLLRSAKGDYARFCFGQSFDLLESRNERGAIRLLYAAARFVDGADRDALGFVANIDRSYDRDQSLAALAMLSLANFHDGRFSLLPLTRGFVLAELGRDLVEEKHTLDRWFQWHVELTHQAAAGGADLDSDILAVLHREHLNILWAIDEAIRVGRITDVFVTLLRSLEFFWLESGRWNEFERYLTIGKDIAPAPEDRSHFCIRLMWLNVLRRRFATAHLLAAEAEALLAQFPSAYERMRLDDFEGELALEEGDFDEARAKFTTSLEEAEQLDDRRGLFACNKYLGDLACDLSEVELAQRHHDRAAEFVGTPGDNHWLRGRAFLTHLRARILQSRTSYDQAIHAFRECLALLEFHPDARLKMKAGEGIALCERALGNTSEARRLAANIEADYQRLAIPIEGTATDSLLREVSRDQSR